MTIKDKLIMIERVMQQNSAMYDVTRYPVTISIGDYHDLLSALVDLQEKVTDLSDRLEAEMKEIQRKWEV